MSRRRIPGEKPESFNLRWHSVANPATPSVDIMSSPDPLNDPDTPDPITSSSTRRITRSQRAQKFLSLGVSPRKQTYELDVGNSSRSSRGLLVSVETSEDDAQDGDARRQLFPTPSSGPSSRRREKITTTTVPLKDSIEDESSDVLGPSSSTPQPRRGRIRTSNGTPIPKSGRKRRAPTPIRRTPRRPQTVPDSMSSDNASDAGDQGSPTPKRRLRTRTPKKRAIEPPSERELGVDPASAMASVRRSGRRRRQALAPDELAGLADSMSSPAPTQEASPSEDGMRPTSGSARPASRTQNSIPTPGSEADAESDIWMTTMSQDATPRASALNTSRQPSSATLSRMSREPAEPEFDHDGGYGYLPPAASDDSSVNEAPAAPTVRNDTIAQGEDFSMILMDSIPSRPADLSRAGQPTNESELGEETNLIINNTLESLRNGADADREDEGEDDELEASEEGSVVMEENSETPSDERMEPISDVDISGDDGGSVSNETQPSVQDHLSVQQAHPWPEFSAEPGLFVSQDADLEREAEQFATQLLQQQEREEQEREEQEREQQEREEQRREEQQRQEQQLEAQDYDSLSEGELVPEPTPIRSASRNSPKPPSPRLVNPLRKQKSSPLRHRVLRQGIAATQDSHGQHSVGNSPDRTPRAIERNVHIQEESDGSELYDDSFSEIPDAVLDAATPKRPGMSLAYNDEMEDDVDEEAMEAAFDEAEVHQQTTFAEQERLENEGHDVHMEQDIQGEADEEDALPEMEVEEEVEEQVEEEVEEEVEDEVEEEVEEEDFAQEFQAQGFGGRDAEYSADKHMNEAAVGEADSLLEAVMGGGHRQAFNEEAPLARSVPLRLSSPRDVPQAVQEEQMEVAVPSEAPQSAPRRSRSRSLLSSPRRRARPAQQSPLQPSPNAALQQSTAIQVEAESQRSGSSKDATPRNQISSPLQEPQSLVQEAIYGSRPALSSIVRAGRVLQSVTSDPPSPEGRERQLGSPFRSSGSRDSHGGSREGQDSRIASRSPTARTLNFARPPSAASPTLRKSPFTNVLKRSEPPAASTDAEVPAEAGAIPTNRSMSSRPSANSSMRHSPPSEGVMSWVANEAPLSPNLRGDNSLREAALSSTTKFSRPPFVPVQEPKFSAGVPATAPAAAGSESSEEVRDDETDIWEIEARRETPKTAKQASFGTSKRFPQSQRRSGLPISWMRSSQTAPKSPGSKAVPVHLTLEKEGSPEAEAEGGNEAEEYSLLEKRREEEAQRSGGSPAKGSKFDLSSFFSSPAAIPGMIAGKLFPTASKPAEPVRQEQKAPPVVAPVTSAGNLFPQVPQKQFRPATSGRRDLFSPSRSQQSQQPSQVSATRGSASPDTPEQLGRPTSAGNQTFTPRQRQTSSTFAHSSSRQSAAVTPPRMQLSHADIRRWQQDMSSASASADESSDFTRPLLRPLPPKNASPTKSSLRSPLKPRTPGRVVEFTSSVLSPLDQARARQQSHMSSSVASQSNSALQQPRRRQPSQQRQAAAPLQQQSRAPAQQVQQPQHIDTADQDANDKENYDSSDISMADAPPLEHGPLSQTTWTRQHWLLLDELLQLRRQTPFDPRYERRSDKYLGKTVKSQGEAMQLQRWHLDCVDAFKAEVGGWDEGTLAKRLFALILGEEKRLREAEERNRPAAAAATSFMFH